MLKRKTKSLSFILKKSFRKKLNKNIKTIIQKVNFFDLLIFLSLLIIGVILILNRMQKENSWVNVRVSIENSDWWYGGVNPKYWYAQNLKIGDVAYDSFGKESAKIKNIENYDAGEQGRIIFVDLEVQTNFDKKRKQYLYEFKPLTVGGTLLLNFGKEQLRGLVVSIDDEDNNFEYKTITVNKSFMTADISDKIKEGEIIKDSNGEEVAKIIAVEKKITEYYEFSDIRGEKILVKDPHTRAAKITMLVKTVKVFDQYYLFNGRSLKVGDWLDLNFSDFVVSGVEITEIN